METSYKEAYEENGQNKLQLKLQLKLKDTVQARGSLWQAQLLSRLKEDEQRGIPPGKNPFNSPGSWIKGRASSQFLSETPRLSH